MIINILIYLMVHVAIALRMHHVTEGKGLISIKAMHPLQRKRLAIDLLMGPLILVLAVYFMLTNKGDEQ